MSHPEWGDAGKIVFSWPLLGRPWIETLEQASQWVAVILTLFSGATYLWRNRHLYLGDM
jgi:hypothetical protein